MNNFSKKPIPSSTGIGLRPPHYKQVINEKPDIAWLEVHSENFFADGGMNIRILQQVRENYPISLHGVGLSLGTTDKLDNTHLQKLKRLVDNFEPGLVSEHISWSSQDGIFINDLLPLPYTKDALKILVNNIEQTQNYIGRQILIENPSSYLEFNISDISEDEFINEVVKQSGCGLLLDINNIYVSGENHDFDAEKYINNISKNIVQEVHLAGHESQKIKGGTILIDTHSDHVKDEVWSLYLIALRRFGNVPTLIEWDTKIPKLEVLIDEAKKAQRLMDQECGEHYAT